MYGFWRDIGPCYGNQGYDHKTDESRGTEAVLNALILASLDAQTGQLSDDTHIAFDNMWALQQTAGEDKSSWHWLQFDQEPWEANDSGYYGAALAAMAVGTAPGNYAASAEIQNKLKSLSEYLNWEIGLNRLEMERLESSVGCEHVAAGRWHSDGGEK